MRIQRIEKEWATETDQGVRMNLKTEYDLEKCPRCESQAAVDFEEHMIYCTGCPLSVQDTTMQFRLLCDIWNNLKTDIGT